MEEEKKKKKHNPICYINSFATLLTKKYIYKNIYKKTITSLKFHISANMYEKY